MARTYYTVYLKRTDEIVCCGTASECAKAMSKTINGFYSMISKNNRGKHHKYEIYKDSLDSND